MYNDHFTQYIIFIIKILKWVEECYNILNIFITQVFLHILYIYINFMVTYYKD